MLALNGGRPTADTLRDFLQPFITFREEVVARRTAFDSARPANAATCCAASPSPSPTSTRSSAPSAPPTTGEAREKLMTRRWPAQDIAR